MGRPSAGHATIGVGESGFAMRMEPVRRWAADWADILALAAFGCAIFLSLGTFMPDWFARTSWSSGNYKSRMAVFDSPASYVGLMSLCGLVAFVALAVALWRRLAVATALVAAAAFIGAVYLTGSTWLSLARGTELLDGRPAQMGPKWTVHTPTALPLFVFAAVVGVICALALAIAWMQQPRDT